MNILQICYSIIANVLTTHYQSMSSLNFQLSSTNMFFSFYRGWFGDLRNRDSLYHLEPLSDDNEVGKYFVI